MGLLIGISSYSIKGNDNELLLYLTFVPSAQNDLYLRNYAIDKGEYKLGTIGEMNGMNHPSIPLPEENLIEWLMQWEKGKGEYT